MTPSRLAPRLDRSQRGFTLVELMYATGYFMLGLLGLVCFQLVAATGTQRAADIMLATNITANVIETTRVTALNTVVNAPQPVVTTYDRFGNPGAVPTYFSASSRATQVPGKAYYELAVETTWKANGNPFLHKINMQTRIPTE